MRHAPLLLLLFVSCIRGADLSLPGGVDWGREPIEDASPYRARICLNGVWCFQPGQAAQVQADPAAWGRIRVPGSWRPCALPGLTVRGTGPAWERGLDESPLGVYERDIAIPADWTGRTILLDLRRVSTDATVWLDGRAAGRVAWPGGEVDLTATALPGRTQRLRIEVVAVADSGLVTRYMGQGEGQVLTEKAVLASRGIIGDVLLQSRPSGAHLTGCAIATSVRNRELAVTAEYAGLGAAAPVELAATVRDAAGREVRRFTATVDATAGSGAVRAAWSWPDPELWDLDHPVLYRLELAVRAAGFTDRLDQEFGFREFRIDGKRFLLNEVEIRLRPAPVHAEGLTAGVREHLAGVLVGLRRSGFNMYEMWPWNRDQRGVVAFDDLWCSEADRLGILLIAPALDNADAIGAWDKPEVVARWEQRMADGVRELRNHPSVMMWATGANRFGHGQDQNPLFIGRAGDPDHSGYRRKAEAGRDALRRIRTLDPTRPAITHAGAAVGDVYTINCYLCLIPLQERSEWPARWAEDGNMPLMMVEFGTPLYSTFHRGRRSYPDAEVSEPFYTEYAAIYQGAEAYRLETPEYRGLVSGRFVEGQTWKSWHTTEVAGIHPGFDQLEALFNATSWRTWRTWGVTGGMLPWENGHGWLRRAPQPVPTPAAAWEPGRRGAWLPQLSTALLRYFDPDVMPMTDAGRALVAANGDSLAWIAGAAPDRAGFTDRSCHFRAGSQLAKQSVLINDGRTSESFDLRWHMTVDGKIVAQGQDAGDLPPATTRFSPILADVPTVAVDRTDGAIELDARIGDARFRDRFPVRIFRPLSPIATSIATVDPVGDTTAMLGRIGAATTAWTGGTDRLLVVGRRAISDRSVDAAQIEAFVRAGGRVLMMAQDPGWYADRLGLRLAPQAMRNVFPAIPGHPAIAGLDADDLRDWTGHSRLLPHDEGLSLEQRTPLHGWRWGTRHAVTSAAIEVPMRAGWQPILRCGFDGAYTPLASIRLGSGMIVVCTLDLEDHVAEDPAAERLMRNLLAWTASAPAQPSLPTVYIGGESGAELINEIGIICDRAKSLPADGLVLLGEDADVDAAAGSAFLARGGRILALPGHQERGQLGRRLRRVESFPGSLAVPAWPECAGLWPGELRRRADGPAWLLADDTGTGIAADGLLGLQRSGSGVAVYCQIDPVGLDADRLSWNRTTRWRGLRAIAQLAANLGASFAFDRRIVAPATDAERMAISDGWQAALTQRVRAPMSDGSPPVDPGPSPVALALVKPDADLAALRPVRVPAEWESYGGDWTGADGEAVFRRILDIPASWAGKDLDLALGLIDDFDTVYFDGQIVGRTTSATPAWWTLSRAYIVPGTLVTTGKHTLAVRVFDHGGAGGLFGEASKMRISVRPPENAYRLDWRKDFILGDDPWRYTRW
ncbi:MAG: beta-galactosidase [Planctomycetes bacterium]|nr:beta-galactosidase [Planctomycetota bacterium]